MGETVLGLKMGRSTIGWSLVAWEKVGQGHVVAAGVRAFDEPIEPKSREPRNAARRKHRGQRRNTLRRSLRRQELRRILVEGGLMPAAAEGELAWLKSTNPYELRVRALREALKPHEVGRIFLHLVQRRGFLSNSKARGLSRTGDPEVDRLIEQDKQKEIEAGLQALSDAAQSPKTTGLMLKSINELNDEITQSGSPSLGAHLAKQVSQGRKVRGRSALRAMVEKEFELIWQKQAEARPQVFTESLRLQIHRTIFFQRPLIFKAHMPSKCIFEPTKNAIPKGHYLAQWLSIWQVLSDIELTSVESWEKRRLTSEEKERASAELRRSPRLSWAGFRKAVGLLRKDKVIISHEGRRALADFPGCTTEAKIQEIIGPAWEQMAEEQKDTLMEILFCSGTDLIKLKRLKKEMGVSAEQAYLLARSDFSRAVGDYSAKAAKKLLHRMMLGDRFAEAVERLGYGQGLAGSSWQGPKLTLEGMPDVPNPVVSKILHESRKVINAIVRRHGLPGLIKFSLHRDVTLNEEERREIFKGKRRDEQRNQRGRDKYIELYPGREPSWQDLQRFRLFVECKGVCPYTGGTIHLNELWTRAWKVEHIIPYPISLDDSMSNLTLCSREVSETKGQRLPIECFGAGSEEWSEAARRCLAWGCGDYKKRKFTWIRERLPDDCISRHFSDTRYAARLIKDYLEGLCVKVDSLTGRHTAILRRAWGLHDILDPGAGRRDDHRHQAVDAIVIALTSPSLVKMIADLTGKGEGREHSEWHADLPWPKLRQQAETVVESIIVSHEPTRRIRGALHEETGHGHQEGRGFTTRKALCSMSLGEVDRIVDHRLKIRMKEHLSQFDGDPKQAFANSDALKVVDRHGVVHEVRRALVRAQRQNEGSYMATSRGRFLVGTNHWCLIIERRDGSCDRTALIIPLWQAVRAKHEKTGPESFVPTGWRLVAALCKNDMVELTGSRAGFYRVRKFSPEAPVDLNLDPHFCSCDSMTVRIRSSAGLKAEVVGRIEVDPIGELSRQPWGSQ